MQEIVYNEKKKTKIRTPQRIRNTIIKGNVDEWDGLDLSAHGIKFISLNLFDLSFLKELFLQKNELTAIPKQIVELRNLEVLDISENKLSALPVEMGKMVQLKTLKLNDNHLGSIPIEFGTLYQIEIFLIDNNPLTEPFGSLYKTKGGISVIQYCRENNSTFPIPHERLWLDHGLKKDFNGELISVATYNILSPHYATTQLFGYVSPWILHWENRREMIFQELVSYGFDILGIQEMETFTFIENYKEQFENRCNYDSIFYPSSRCQSLPENQKMMVDGCATFWKRQKFSLIDQKCLKFADIVFNDPRFANNDDIINRNSGKDNIALITVLEKDNGGFIIVSNVHIHWNPEFPDVKLFQVLILIETIQTYQLKYPTAGMILLGDYNSPKDSAVYEVLTKGYIEPYNIDFSSFINYKPFMEEGFQHNLGLKDAYSEQDLEFTNFSAHFKGILDYIFYNDKLVLNNTLSAIDDEYANIIVGLPTAHFPSDHIILGAKFQFKGIKNKKKDFHSRI